MGDSRESEDASEFVILAIDRPGRITQRTELNEDGSVKAQSYFFIDDAGTRWPVVYHFFVPQSLLPFGESSASSFVHSLAGGPADYLS